MDNDELSFDRSQTAQKALCWQGWQRGRRGADDAATARLGLGRRMLDLGSAGLQLGEGRKLGKEGAKEPLVLARMDDEALEGGG